MAYNFLRSKYMKKEIIQNLPEEELLVRTIYQEAKGEGREDLEEG